MMTSADEQDAGGRAAKDARGPDENGSAVGAAPTDEDRAASRPSETVDVEMPESDDQVMDSLRSHVPITLLMDLSNPEGPHSAEIAEEEGGDADWLDTGDGQPE